MLLGRSAPKVATRDSHRELLAQAPILQGCPVDQLEELVRLAQIRKRPAGTLLLAQNDVVDELYLIASGRVRLVRGDGPHREITLRELTSGDFFGEVPLVDADETQPADAIAVDDVTLLVISRDGLAEHLQRHPSLALRMALVLSRHLRSANHAIAEMALHGVEARLVRALERLARAHGGVPSHAGLMLHRRPTHRELANLIGTRRETVSRALASLARDGLLVVRGARILLTRTLLDRLGPAT
jgi:CRP-like cAMP-binding protein